MKKIVNLFLSTWDALSEDQKQAALNQVSPNAVLKEAVMTWSDARRIRQMEDAELVDIDEVDEEEIEDDIIDAEFIDMKDTFGGK